VGVFLYVRFDCMMCMGLVLICEVALY